ncbi:hypothetical protein ACX3YG_23265 [Pseudomonas wadenswilerensis]
MQKTVWVSYDLGVKGDYASLYRWFDNMGATECGDGMAYIKINIEKDVVIPDYIKAELQANVTFSRSDRIYIVWSNPDGQPKGRFIVGRRKAAPWAGYGDVAEVEDDI